jgi:pilus assembly protein CpaC
VKEHGMSSRKGIMKTISIALLLFVGLICSAGAPMQAKAVEQTEVPPTTPQVDIDNTAAQLRVMAGKSLLLRSPEPLQRVSITDPSLATGLIVSPSQVLIHGFAPGSVTLMLWDSHERARSFTLNVELDVENLQHVVANVFPAENIKVSQSGGSVVLLGKVTSKDVSDRAALLAATQSKNVVNLLQTTEGNQVVMLQVKFAEVDRAAIQQLGLNLFSTGALNTFGSVTTQQFGSANANVGSLAPPFEGTSVNGNSVATGAIANHRLKEEAGFPSNANQAGFGFSDLLNVFLFRPDLNLGATIKALQQKNVLQILAEPNVLALNGAEASFLAGGEFPFPVIQNGAAYNAVTIVFKEFGVRLKFTPTVMADGVIRLKVAPEVSSLDFSNALTISGFLIPALSTRRADTQVELRDGQSFAIAGLMDNRLSEIGAKVPLLGDLPIIGTFFKSRATNRANTELMVMITPRLVRALDPSQVPPPLEYPRPFLDKEKFDGKSGATPAKRGSADPAVNNSAEAAAKND